VRERTAITGVVPLASLQSPADLLSLCHRRHLRTSTQRRLIRNIVARPAADKAMRPRAGWLGVRRLHAIHDSPLRPMRQRVEVDRVVDRVPRGQWNSSRANQRIFPVRLAAER
jgi:hypothetical protein